MVCFHARCMDNSGEIGNITVRASDTDIAIILLYHSPPFTATLLMDTGTNGRNTRKYINLTAVGEVMGALLCESLPAFHAFTGCDYTSAFVRKGKKRPFAILEKKQEHTASFCQSRIGQGRYRQRPQITPGIHSFYVWSEAEGESDASEHVQIQGIPEGLWPKSNRKTIPWRNSRVWMLVDFLRASQN